MSAEDDKFFEGIGEQFEGYFPGLPERIDELHFQQYGRGIATSSGSRKLESMKDKLVGYILPVEENQEKHLLVFKDGDMMVVVPDKQITLSAYQSEFSPNDALKRFAGFNLSEIKHYYLTSVLCQVILRNDSPVLQEEISKVIDQAIDVAKKLKEQRMRARDTSAKEFIQKIDQLLKPFEPPSQEE